MNSGCELNGGLVFVGLQGRVVFSVKAVVWPFLVVSIVLGSWVSGGLEDVFWFFQDAVKGEADCDDPVVSFVMEFVGGFKGGPSESALVTVTSSTIQRKAARWPWEGIGARPTGDTAAAIVQGPSTQGISSMCHCSRRYWSLVLPEVLFSLKCPFHVELMTGRAKKNGVPLNSSPLCVKRR